MVIENSKDIQIYSINIKDGANGILIKGENTSNVNIMSSYIGNCDVGIKVEGGSDITIGGNVDGLGNYIFGNGIGILAQGPISNLEIQNNRMAKCSLEYYGDFPGNTVGIKLEGVSGAKILNNSISDSAEEGILLTNGTCDTLICGNYITKNQIGVLVDGATSLRNSIISNVITDNLGKGIALRNGGNRNIPSPVITNISTHSVSGNIGEKAPEGSHIEIYADFKDEGEEKVASVPVKGRTFYFTCSPPQGKKLHAIFVDKDGNTSEFGPVNLSSVKRFTSVFVYTSTRDRNEEIYKKYGNSTTRLTDNGAPDNTPKLSPDGRSIVFVSMRSGNPDLWKMSIRGDELKQLTNAQAPDYDPAWSPDGRRIVFVSERDGNPDLYILNLEDNTITRLTQTQAEERYPCWHGDKIAFASKQNGNWDIFVVNADGTGLTQLTNSPANETQPAWSPDGGEIAFVSDADGSEDIWTMKADGTMTRNLAETPYPEKDPCWTRDGFILFSSQREGGWEIYQIKPSGGNATRLTTSLGENTQPSAR